MRKKEYKIISVGGSIIIPKTGFNVPFLKKFREFIINRVKNGERFILVIGGGNTCREYQNAGKRAANLSAKELDWIGIHTTVFNANFMKYFFGKHANHNVIVNPTKKIKTNKPILLAAGWRPGCSTDYDAVLLAKTYGAKKIINLSNIKYVYDKDPHKYKSAKKITEISWSAFRKKIVGTKWEAGKHAPFDPIASQKARLFGLSVTIVQGTNLKEVGNALDGKKFKGTIIL